MKLAITVTNQLIGVARKKLKVMKDSGQLEKFVDSQILPSGNRLAC